MRSAAFPLLLVLCGCASVHEPPILSDVCWSLGSTGTGRSMIRLTMESDLAPDSGFTVPNARQSDDGTLHVRFRLADPSGKGRRFRYAVHYRNET